MKEIIKLTGLVIIIIPGCFLSILTGSAGLALLVLFTTVGVAVLYFDIIENTNRYKFKNLIKFFKKQYFVIKFIFGITEKEGYIYREVETLPIVGNHFYKGFEIINPNTNKVVYRSIKDWGIVPASSYLMNDDDYRIKTQFYSKNIIIKKK